MLLFLLALSFFFLTSEGSKQKKWVKNILMMLMCTDNYICNWSTFRENVKLIRRFPRFWILVFFCKNKHGKCALSRAFFFHLHPKRNQLTPFFIYIPRLMTASLFLIVEKQKNELKKVKRKWLPTLLFFLESRRQFKTDAESFSIKKQIENRNKFSSYF